jgi:hypothetical protein
LPLKIAQRHEGASEAQACGQVDERQDHPHRDRRFRRSDKPLRSGLEVGAKSQATTARGASHLRRSRDAAADPDPRRWALLRDLRRTGPSSVRALSQAQERDYKTVHTEVKELERIGLIARDAHGRILVPWSRIAAELELAA